VTSWTNALLQIRQPFHSDICIGVYLKLAGVFDFTHSGCLGRLDPGGEEVP